MWKSILVLLFSMQVFGAEPVTLEGKSFERQVKVGEKTLLLNGVGLRFVSFLGIRVKVYSAGLYVEKVTQSAKELVMSDTHKRVILKFLRDAPKSKIKKAWATGVEKNCIKDCAVVQRKVKEFNNIMPGVKENQVLTIDFLGDELVVSLEGKKLGSLKDKLFTKTMLNVFLGENPPNEELKEGFLTPLAPPITLEKKSKVKN